MRAWVATRPSGVFDVRRDRLRNPERSASRGHEMAAGSIASSQLSSRRSLSVRQLRLRERGVSPRVNEDANPPKKAELSGEGRIGGSSVMSSILSLKRTVAWGGRESSTTSSIGCAWVSESKTSSEHSGRHGENFSSNGRSLTEPWLQKPCEHGWEASEATEEEESSRTKYEGSLLNDRVVSREGVEA